MYTLQVDFLTFNFESLNEASFWFKSWSSTVDQVSVYKNGKIVAVLHK